MKSTILLTTALFLASAPAPDSGAISELSGGFLVDTGQRDLLAAGVVVDGYTQKQASVPVTGQVSVNQVTADELPSAGFNLTVAGTGAP